MRFFKCILMLTVFAVLFAMLPAAVAEDGVVTARAKGTAVITVNTFNGKRATVKIAVN